MGRYKGLKAILKKFSDLIEPPGSVKLSASVVEPVWHFYCEGDVKPIAGYQKLYVALGGENSPWNLGNEPEGYFRLPDMRECAAAGIGHNETRVFNDTETNPATNAKGNQNHDEYVLGEFHDDQFQGHDHEQYQATSDDEANWNSSYRIKNWEWRATRNILSKAGYGTARYGTTTHGKRVGLYYIIKY